MFLHLSVILFMGVMMSLPVWLLGAMFLTNGGLCPGDLCQRGGLCPGEVYVQRLSLCPQGVLCPYTYPGGSPARSVGSLGCRCRGRSSGSCAA